MRKCWAQVLGNCGGGLSGEHVLSKGLFKGKSVQVQGGIWKTEALKSIGINSLIANIVCRAHNSELSGVDVEGIAAFHAIRRFEEILSNRIRHPRSTDLEHIASGNLLERWFLKHTINLFIINSRDRTWYDGSEATSPPRDIVEAVFGKNQLEYPRGLYHYAGLKLGDKKIVADQVGFVPVFSPDNRCVGASFEFQALSFLIWLHEKEIPWQNIREFYHHVGGYFEAPPLRASFHVNWF